MSHGMLASASPSRPVPSRSTLLGAAVRGCKRSTRGCRSGLASALWLLAAALPGAVAAQTIYRCGHAYSTATCPNGVALVNDDARSAAQRTEARAAATERERLAATMERDRRRQEASLRPAAAGSLGPARPARETAAASHKVDKSLRKPVKPVAATAEPFIAAAPLASKPRR